MKILSFGRSALSTTDRIRRVVEIIKQAYRLNHELAVVVSAMTGVTDVLIQIPKMLQRTGRI